MTQTTAPHWTDPLIGADFSEHNGNPPCPRCGSPTNRVIDLPALRGWIPDVPAFHCQARLGACWIGDIHDLAQANREAQP